MVERKSVSTISKDIRVCMGQNIYQCSKCGSKVKKNKICIIDNKPICLICVYGKVKPFEIYPIGIVRNNLRRSDTNFGTIGEMDVSCIELISSQKLFMYKLSEEKYLTIVYYFHKARSVKSVFKRGLDGKEVGIFASRTPDRLSKIAIQDVRLLKIEGMTLYVEGLDAISGSPILDIKLKM